MINTYVRDWLFPTEDFVGTYKVKVSSESPKKHFYYRVYCTTFREEPAMTDYESDTRRWRFLWEKWEKGKDVVYKRYDIDRATVEGSSGKRRVAMFSEGAKFPIEDWEICVDQTGQKKLTCRFNDERDVVHPEVLDNETVKLDITNVEWEKQKARRDKEYKNGEIEFVLN